MWTTATYSPWWGWWARLARQRGARGMTADVLATNQAMIKVFEKGGFPVRNRFEDGV